MSGAVWGGRIRLGMADFWIAETSEGANGLLVSLRVSSEVNLAARREIVEISQLICECKVN